MKGQLGKAFAQAQQWERAEAVRTKAEALIHKMYDNKERSFALVGRGKTLAGAQQWERATAVRTEIEALISAIGVSEEPDEVLGVLASAFVQL